MNLEEYFTNLYDQLKKELKKPNNSNDYGLITKIKLDLVIEIIKDLELPINRKEFK